MCELAELVLEEPGGVVWFEVEKDVVLSFRVPRASSGGGGQGAVPRVWVGHDIEGAEEHHVIRDSFRGVRA